MELYAHTILLLGCGIFAAAFIATIATKKGW